MKNRAINFFRLAFVAWILIQLFGVDVNAQVFLKAHKVGPCGGGETDAQLTAVSYNPATNTWTLQLAITVEGSQINNGASCAFDTTQVATCGGSFYCGYSYGTVTATNSTFTPGSAISIEVLNTAGNSTVSGLVPPAPALQRSAIATDTNNSDVNVLYVYKDAVTGAVIYSINLAPGQTNSVSILSNGDDINEYAYTTNSSDPNSLSGDASINLSTGNVTSGTTQYQAFVGTIAYGTMSSITGAPDGLGGGGGNTGGTTAVPGNQDAPVIVVSGVDFSISQLGNNPSGMTQVLGATPVVFGGGTGTGMTGSVSGLTQGVFVQGVNGITQVLGNDLNGIELNMIKSFGNLISAVDAGSGGGGGSSFPSSIAVNNFPAVQLVSGTVTVSNMLSGISVVFPSSIVVSNMPSSFGSFPSSVAVNNFPSSFAINNLPSGFGAFPSSVLVGNMISTSNIEGLLSGSNVIGTQTYGLISSGVAMLGAISGSISGQGAFDQAQLGLVSGNPTVADMASGGSGAGTAESGSVPGYSNTPLGDSLGTDPSSAFSIVMPMAFGGATINFSMLGTGPLAGIISAFRDALLWLVLVYYGIYCWKGLRPWIIGAVSSPQAHGNPVLGGTGAQATALVAAGLISVALLVALVALFALLGDVGFGAISSAFSGGNPLGSFPSGVLWMLNQCFPISAIVGALLGRMVFDALASKIFLVVTSTIRYVVP